MSSARPDSLLLANDVRQRVQSVWTEDGTWHRLWRAWVRPAILIFLLWTAVGVFMSVPDVFNGFQWPVSVGRMIDSWAWALMTPAFFMVDRRLASIERHVVRLTLLFVLLSVPFSLVHTYLTGILLYPIPEVWWNPLRRHDFFVYYFLGSFQVYSAMVGIVYAFKYYNRFLTSQLQLERAEKGLIESRLSALRLQLEPHFLFNALNTISSEVTTDPNLARDMIGDLGALLRQSLDCKDRTEITLAQELSLLDHYLSIQRVRFGDRMEIGIDVEPEVLSVMVPSMLLQPLVENAIRHGIEGRVSGGKVMISAWQAANHLEIRVSDDGIGLPPDWRMEASTGLGVRLARERLAGLYPDPGEHSFAIHRREGGGTEVEISMPLSRTRIEAA
jgi:two-component sensor histidine kinase